MTLNILLSATATACEKFSSPIERALQNAGISADLRRDHTADQVDYIVYAPNGPVTDFSDFSRLKAVLGLWAGVENIVGIPSLTVPLTRMADSGLQEGMTEWVTGHVLRYHLGIDRHITDQTGKWNPDIPPLARDRSIGILGMGALGAACAKALVALNFNVHGWSRSKKNLNGITCYFGVAGLGRILGESEILVLLLPHTPRTENLINEKTLAMLPKGARIINPGRGALIQDKALLGALQSGQIGHATLDVFRTEPLPPSHPYWGHPNVTVTPHIASDTRAKSAAEFVTENIRLNEAGEQMNNIVNRKAGY